MALENILSQEIVQKLGWTLLHFVWQAVAVTLLLGILLAVLRKSSANLRYIVACAHRNNAVGLGFDTATVSQHRTTACTRYCDDAANHRRDTPGKCR